MSTRTLLRRSLALALVALVVLAIDLMLAAHDRRESVADLLAREAHCLTAFTPDSLGGQGRALCRAGFPVSPTGVLSTTPSAEPR